LRTQIQAGEYRPRDPLPTEETLTRTFGVSRITVRGALQLLADEGLIVRRSGKGTFVAPLAGQGHSLWAAITVPDVVYDGQEITRRYLSRRMVWASARVAESLRVPERSQVLQVEGLMVAGETPLAHVTLHLPGGVARRLPKGRIVEKPLIQLLCEVTGLQVGAVDQWTTASLADSRAAEALGIAAGDPVLLIERIFYDSNNNPIEVAINRYRADGFRHHVRLQPSKLVERRRVLQRDSVGFSGDRPSMI
jgi:GntR family transcriptional regulator